MKNVGGQAAKKIALAAEILAKTTAITAIMERPGSATNTATAAYVIVARHGERLDYQWRDQLRRNWVQEQKDMMSGGGRPWDPPLTDHGWEQGRRLGKQLGQEVSQRGIPPVSAVFASPFLRCRQTALAAREGLGVDAAHPAVPPVRVECGIAESLNEDWYRSWALPGADGSWGYRLQPHSSEDPFDPRVEVHPAAQKPVQSLLADWKEVDACPERYDLSYKSVAPVEEPYALRPQPLLESPQHQRLRMRSAVERLATVGRTIVLVSHGGPVTHLFESLTQGHWHTHGEPSYCCYSLYRGTPPDATRAPGPNEWKWEVLVLNESRHASDSFMASVPL